MVYSDHLNEKRKGCRGQFYGNHGNLKIAEVAEELP